MPRQTEDPNLRDDLGKETTDWWKLIRNLGAVAVIVSALVAYAYYQISTSFQVDEVGRDLKDVKQEIKDVKADLNTVKNDVSILSVNVDYIKKHIEKSDLPNGVAATSD